MRFMMIVKASEQSEAGVMPSEDMLSEMMGYNEELVRSGAMIDGSGLHPSSKGARVNFSGREPSVQPGPFSDPQSLIAGYWIISADSFEQAVEWARKAPFEDGQVEVRQLFELEDFEQGPAIEQMRQMQNDLASQ